jgi:outer membrane protein TolC
VLRLAAGIGALALLSACAAGSAERYRALDQRLAEREAEAAASATQGLAQPNPFAGRATLGRAALVAEVLRRNPSIAAARFAWRAALARYPQERALDDPMFGYGLGPRTFTSDEAPQIGQRFELSQALPFPGKRALRGAAALAEAEAAAHDYEAVRLRLASMASMLYDESWLLARAAELNRQHLDLVRELREIATARSESGSAEQQDPLRAEVEETELLHRQVELEATQRVTAQQLAALLHLRNGAALPPPPEQLAAVEVDEPASSATDAALAGRPELRAADARVHGKEAAEDLALREYFPDFRVMAVYDRFWEISDLQPMVGFELNVPLQLARRRAAVEQARAELEMARRERERMEDEVATEVVIAREQLAAATHLLELARDRMLPAARDQLAAARSGYEAGRVDFADVIEAERAVRNAELGVEEGRAEASRRAAELAAALGRVPGFETPPPGERSQPTTGGSHD